MLPKLSARQWIDGVLVTSVAGALAVGWSASSDRPSRRPAERSSLDPLHAVGTPAKPAAASADPWPPRAAARAWTTIVLHHSATSEGDVPSIDAVHRQQKDAQGRPWLGIGYHFVIGNGHKMGDGEIQPTFRWRDQLPGAHAGRREFNDFGIGICLIGNFDLAPPTFKQRAAAHELVRQLAERYHVKRGRILPHRDVQATACPGKLFPWDELLGGASPRDDGS